MTLTSKQESEYNHKFICAHKLLKNVDDNLNMFSKTILIFVTSCERAWSNIGDYKSED